jgi:carbon storage regulator
MLVIARKIGQTILLGDEVEITVSSIRGDQVRLAIQAPRSVTIFRKETVEQVKRGNATAIDSAAGLLDLLGGVGQEHESGRRPNLGEPPGG